MGVAPDVYAAAQAWIGYLGVGAIVLMFALYVFIDKRWPKWPVW